MVYFLRIHGPITVPNIEDPHERAVYVPNHVWLYIALVK